MGSSPTAGSFLSGAGSALGAVSGLQRGGVQGYGSAAVNAAQLYGRVSNSPTAQSFNNGAGYGANALGIYSGLKQGGVAGYGGAAVNAAQLGSRLGAFGGYSGAVGTAAGYVAAPLAIYNAVSNYKSGATGSDALNGAEAGAAIGSLVGPVGTVVGGVIGGAVGAVSSAFGAGKMDQENTNWNSFVPQYNKANAQQQQQMLSSLSPSQSFQMLAGVMDAKDPTAGHSEQLEQVFGRMGENTVMTQMAQQINSAISSGQISKSATPQQIYQQVVTPWLKSKGVTIGMASPTQQGMIVGTNQSEGGALQGVLTNLIGAWQSGSLNANTSVGISGQKITGLPVYG